MTAAARLALAWLPRPPLSRLGPDEVHVWRVPLAPPPARLAPWPHAPDDDASARAVLLRAATARDTATLARSASPALTRRSPGELELGYPQWKPYLFARPASPCAYRPLRASSRCRLRAGRELRVTCERRRRCRSAVARAHVILAARSTETL